MNNDQICNSTLPSVISEYILFISTEYAEELCSFMMNTDISVLNCVLWKVLLYVHETSDSASKLLFSVIAKRIAEFDLHDTYSIFTFADTFLNRSGVPSQLDTYQDLLTAIDKEVLRKLCLITQCEISYNGFERFARNLSKELLTEEERKKVSELKILLKYQDGFMNGGSRIIKINDSFWQSTFVNTREKVFFVLLEIDTLRSWRLDFEPNNSHDQIIEEISVFPIDIQKFIYSVLLGKLADESTDSHRIFEQLKSLGVDREFLWYMDDYILTHVNEDSFLEKAYIIDNLYTCSDFRFAN